MYEIFEELLRNRGLTVYRVAKDTGLNAAMFTSWKKGTYKPKQDKLKKIADYFNVSVDYLITGEDTETLVESEQDNIAYKNALKFYELFQKANPEVQKAVEILLKSPQ